MVLPYNETDSMRVHLEHIDRRYASPSWKNRSKFDTNTFLDANSLHYLSFDDCFRFASHIFPLLYRFDTICLKEFNKTPAMVTTRANWKIANRTRHLELTLLRRRISFLRASARCLTFSCSARITACRFCFD